MTLIVGNSGANVLQGGSGADLIYGFDPAGIENEPSSILATRVAAGFTEPVFVTSPPDDLERVFVVEKGGRIKILDLATGAVAAAPFLDISGEIDAAGEGGLLGLAFHSDYARNGLFFVDLINTAGDTEIRRYRRSADDPNRADPASAEVLITIDQPAGLSNHKGGWIGFGPDGFLHVALGDGGGGGDPFDNAQNLDSLLGKILRIDVDSDAFPSDPARNYAVPPDNPFVGRPGADEIWTSGLRNPWRASFDRGTGEMFIGDVGQGRFEEVDLGVAGANYGWRLFEGPAPFSAGGSATGLTFPIFSYGRDLGQSITGGYVYRGEGDALHGSYVFADFVSGRVFTLRQSGSGAWTAVERTGQLAPDAGAVDNPSSFGEDARGNLYLVDFDGDIFRLTPQAAASDASDEVHGGDGPDQIHGGAGDDVLFGDAGDDRIFGGAGADHARGFLGNDLLIGGDGADLVFGEEDDDIVSGAAARRGRRRRDHRRRRERPARRRGRQRHLRF